MSRVLLLLLSVEPELAAPSLLPPPFSLVAPQQPRCRLFLLFTLPRLLLRPPRPCAPPPLACRGARVPGSSPSVYVCACVCLTVLARKRTRVCGCAASAAGRERHSFIPPPPSAASPSLLAHPPRGVHCNARNGGERPHNTNAHGMQRTRRSSRRRGCRVARNRGVQVTASEERRTRARLLRFLCLSCAVRGAGAGRSVRRTERRLGPVMPR